MSVTVSYALPKRMLQSVHEMHGLNTSEGGQNYCQRAHYTLLTGQAASMILI